MKRKRSSRDVVKEVNKIKAADFERLYFPSQLAAFHTPANGTTGLAPSSIKLSVSPASTADAGIEETLSDVDLDACLALVEETSAADYAASSMGWHRGRKRREMRDRDMRFMILRTDNGGSVDTKEVSKTFAGFLSFMITYEDGIPVIYIYEIHLKPSARGSGAGKRLMSIVEKIGQSVGVEKSMLTVFRSNNKAVKWYERLGYALDEYSPPEKKLRGDKVKQANYLILSKTLSRVRDEGTDHDNLDQAENGRKD
ncbi:Acetyltransferase (GNAT)-like protein 1 [Elsinoe fawcettii]|nr:Acetyltransferase (GNAT)-like protein 1 [Elsinoe fawcettii]